MISRKNYREHQTKLRILDAAEDAFAGRGYFGASLSQIAGKVGIAKASLLHHFASKEILYQAILERGFRELGRMLNAALDSGDDEARTLSALVAGFITWIQANPRRTRLMVREQLDHPRQAREVARKYIVPLTERIERFVREGQRKGAFAPVDPRLFLVHMAGSVTHFLVALPSIAFMLDDGDGASQEQILDRFQAYMADVVRRTLTNQP